MTKPLAQAPDYANALFERGSAYYDLGDYQAAMTDFEAARAAGRDDASVDLELGLAVLLEGRFDELIQANRRTIEKDPGLLEARFDLALALLASSQIDAAKAEYAQTLALAAEQVAQAKAAGQQPPASLWWSLDEAAASLDGLLDRLEGFEDSWWSETPPLEKISNPEAVQAATEEIIAQIKSATSLWSIPASFQPAHWPPKSAPLPLLKPSMTKQASFVDYIPADSFPPAPMRS